MLTPNNLYKWQQGAIDKAARHSTGIMAKMGAGKTIVILSSIAKGIEEGRFQRVLLVAPRLILDTVFEVEAERWTHTEHLSFDMAHRHTGNLRRQMWLNGTGDIVTATPDTLATFVTACIEAKTIGVNAAVLDEAQAYKNPGSTRSKAALALSRMVPHVVLSSGTPTPNGPIDAWSPGRMLDPKSSFFIENFYAWRNTHFEKAGSFGFRPKPGAPATINAELAKRSLSIRLEEATDVPPALYTDFPVDHGSFHNNRIAEFMSEGSVEINGAAFGNPEDGDGGFLMRLQELTQGFAYLNDEKGNQFAEVLSMARVEALQEVVESVEGPVLVAVRFKADVDMIRKAFPQAAVYTGAATPGERADIIKRWNNDQIPILLGSPASMGHGLNLQLGSAATIVWYAGSFSYEMFAQFNARLIRGGQRKVVSVISLVSNVGIDKAIGAVIAKKENGEKALLNLLEAKR